MSSGQKRALIWRLSSLGDIVQTWWASYALYQKGYRIEYIVKPTWVGIFEPAFWVQRVWVYEKHLSLTERQRWLREILKEPLDLFWDAHDSLRSWIFGTWIRLQGSKNDNFIYLRTPVARIKRWIWIHFKIDLGVFRQSTAQRFYQMVIGQQIPQPVALKWNFQRLQFWTDQLRQKRMEDYIALAPVASHSLKNWPLTRWQELIEKLYPTKVVILGGKQDEDQKKLGQGMPHVYNLVGQTQLEDVWVLLNLSQAVVAPDTGIFHMAELLRKPAVVLLGPSVGGFPLWEGKTSRVVEYPLGCRGCSPHGQGPCRFPTPICMTAITPDEVLKALESLKGV